MSASPLCEIKDGSAAYVTSVGGVNVTPSNTITIRLASQTDVDSWSIQCLTTDDNSSADTVNASLVIDTVAKTATFTAPVAGRTYRFRSRVNNGLDRNGVAQPSYSTTFCLYTVKNGRRKIAADETTEGSTTYGWIVPFNALIDSVPSGSGDWENGGGGGGGGTVQLFAANNHFLSYQGGSAVGATGMDHIPTGGTVSINRGLLVGGTAVATLANAMLAGGTAATGFQLTRPVVFGAVLGATTVYTGTALAVVGNTRHKRYSEVSNLHTSNVQTTVAYAWNILNEAVTTVVAEVEGVPSGGDGGGSWVRRARIRTDGGVATMGSVESTFSDESPGPGFTGLGVSIGVSGATGFVLVVGTPTGQIDWGFAVSRSETSWA